MNMKIITNAEIKRIVENELFLENPIQDFKKVYEMGYKNGYNDAKKGK